MISRKELEYVSAWANTVPYPGIVYSEEAMEDLEAAVKTYEAEYRGRQYNITFSNGEEIAFELFAKNLPHMLGLDYRRLNSDQFYDYRRDVLEIDPKYKLDAFQTLKAVINHKKNVLAYDNKTQYRVLNYYRFRVKSAIFNRIADLSEFNFGCINFNKDIFNANSEQQCNFGSTKILYVTSNEAVSPYFMLGLKDETFTNKVIAENSEEDEELTSADVTGKKYIVETGLAPIMPKPFFNNQEVVIPTHILYDDNGELFKNSATAQEKIRLLESYRAIISEYNIGNKVNIYGDYMEMLSSSTKRLSKVK